MWAVFDMLHCVVMIGFRLSRAGHPVATFPLVFIATVRQITQYLVPAADETYGHDDVIHYVSCRLVQLLLHVALWHISRWVVFRGPASYPSDEYYRFPRRRT